MEQGKVKCEQYWPELGDTATFGLIDVTTVEESVQVSTLQYSTAVLLSRIINLCSLHI